MNKTKINSIEGLRVIFCIMVCICHYPIVASPTNNPMAGEITNVVMNKLVGFGHLGVEFFFMVSGFLIAYQYKDRLVSYDNETSIFSFIKKRIGKLYFLTIISVLCGVIIGLLTKSIVKINIVDIVLNCLLIACGWFTDKVPDLGSGTWFIFVLFLMYILYYLIARVSGSRQKVYQILALTLTILGVVGIIGNFNIPFLYLSTARGYYSFFAGVLMYELYLISNKHFCEKLSYAFVASVLVWAILYLFIIKEPPYEENVFRFVICPMILFVAVYNDAVKKILSLKAIVYCAKYTMAVFLVNVHVHWCLTMFTAHFNIRLPYGNWLVLLLVLAVDIVVGVCFKLICQDLIMGSIIRRVEKNL